MAGKTPVDKGIVYPPQERARHDLVVYEDRKAPDGSPAYGARAVTQNPMDRYLVRRQISKAQFEAGMRLYRAWYAAGRQPIVAGDYGTRVARGTGDGAEAKEQARWDYTQALRELGPVFSSVAVHVCLVGEAAGDWAVMTGKPADAGICYLRDALDILIRYYEAIYRQRHIEGNSY